MIQWGAYIYVLRNSVHDFGVKMYFTAFMFSMIELSFCRHRAALCLFDIGCNYPLVVKGQTSQPTALLQLLEEKRDLTLLAHRKKIK